MLELLMKYSGITAIIVYSFILFLILKFAPKKEEEPQEKEEVREIKPQTVSNCTYPGQADIHGGHGKNTLDN